MKCKNCGAELTFKNGFYFCDYCKSNYLKEEITPINSINDFSISGGTITTYKGNKEIVFIPLGVVKIGIEAFKNNLIVKKIIFSNTVKEIENSAFEGCANLLQIENYNNISKYGDYCFSFSGLEEILLGNNITSLGKGCFSNMSNLKKVIFNNCRNLKYNHTFYKCHQLKTVEMDKFYFFPAIKPALVLQNNINNRPTYCDAFIDTPFYSLFKKELEASLHDKVCFECGGIIKKGLFHVKCKSCGIDYKN